MTTVEGAATRAARAAPAHGGDAWWDRPLDDRRLGLVVAVVTLPLVWMGYGTDIDVWNVLRSATGIREGTYHPSRTPGVPVFEALTALFDPIGGHLILNVMTAAAAGATVIGIARLVRLWGHDNGDLVALALLASPMTIIAATSLADFIWALVFFVWAAVAHLEGRWAPAGILFALSIGCRLSSGFLIAAFLLADAWDPGHRRRAVRTGLVAAPLGALLFVPSWLAYDRTLEFLENQEGYRSFGNNLGRFLYKNYSATGLAMIVVVALAVPALWATLRHFRDDPLLRFAVLGFTGSQLLYFWMPWKLAHLLPALLCLFLWIAVSDKGTSRRYLWLLVAAVAVNGIVSLRLMAPDEQHAASTGSWSPAVGLGLLLNDIRCRAEFMDEAPVRTELAAWDCTLEPIRGPSETPQR
ncbi:MAG TPA: glycosyltransferase 87 family protein [Acidimicrobiales bacterium]